MSVCVHAIHIASVYVCVGIQRTAQFVLRLPPLSFPLSHKLKQPRSHTLTDTLTLTPLKRLYVSNPHNLVPAKAAVNSSHPSGELCKL